VVPTGRALIPLTLPGCCRMSAARRVVLTGLGVVSPIGLGREAFAASLRAGQGGIRALQHIDTAGLPVRIGATIDAFEPRDYIDKKDRKQLKMMVRTIQLAVAGARLALRDAALNPGAYDPNRLGIVLGTGTIPGELADLGPAAQASYDIANRRVDFERWGRDGLPAIPPTWMLNHVPNMPACHAAILNDARGPNNTITQSDVAGLLAIGEACRVLRGGRADLMLAGGADTRVNAMTLVRYYRFSQLSNRNDEPSRACRPFDAERDGQVLGEGAGVVLLETLAHARARRAHIDAEVLGFACGFDRGRTGDGLARVIRAAMVAARAHARDLDHVNAHAPGTRDDDAWEAHGIRATLGDRPVPVVALKSYFGSLGPGAGVLELAGSVVALAEGTLPATLNHERTDAACPVDVVRTARPIERPCFLKIACTERGQCAAVVLRRWEEDA
jgi:3-oxoacyl-[acyl-carrier-protein] synthase II